jgi:Cof subfamily protein (haloacid dehalogenase superfamily)
VARIRLVALDIDGTLLTSANRLSPAVAAAVRAVAERGVAVALATGRWYESARRWAGRLGLAAPIISHNGARITCPARDEDLLRLPLPLEPARTIARYMDDRGIHAHLTVGPYTYMRPRPDLDPARLPSEIRLVTAFAPYVTEPPLSLLVFDPEGISALPAVFQDRFQGSLRFTVNHTSGTADHLTVHHPAADKGRALARVCAHLGVPPEQTLAIGDAESDTAMFAVAGLAVAMGNATDAVKARATVVAPSNDADGVAWALRYLL